MFHGFITPVILITALVMFSPMPVLGRAFVRETAGPAVIVVKGKESPVRKGAELPVGAVVRTGATGRVTLLLPDGSTAVIRPNSKARVEKCGTANAAFSLEKGLAEFNASTFRIKSEVFEVSTPVATVGVRGTSFLVGVPASGEALVLVEEGKVSVPGANLNAGEAGAMTLEAIDRVSRETLSDSPIAQWSRWKDGRNQRLEQNRGEIAKTIGELLKGSIRARFKAAKASLTNAVDLLRALGTKELGDEREQFVAKVLKIVDVFKTASERLRDVWRNDREAELREGLLKTLVESGSLKPGEKAGAQWALKEAEKNRAVRAKQLAEADKANTNISAALVFLVAAAASDPVNDRQVARLIEEGLGIPLGGTPLAKSPVISWNDLGWTPGARWKSSRTIRGREDFRVEVTMTVDGGAKLLKLNRVPEAFDIPAALRIRREGNTVYLDGIDGLAKKNSTAADKFFPLLLYQFPLTRGDSWRAWEQFPGKNSGLYIERRVMSAERIRVPAGEFDTVRIETRLRNRAKLNLLLNVEWLAPDRGQVREMAFRGELGSLEWDERL